MMRRIESFIRAVIWNRLRKPAWQQLCARTETLFAVGIKRIKALSINITLVRNRTLTARAIGIYAVRKLIAQNRIGPIFKPLIRYLGFMFSGMKFSCKGRFTRRQRASLTVFSRGSVKLSTFTSDIDYSYAHVPLKFGVGCIKIWINRGFRNKNRITNSLAYIPYYKPRKSKIIGLTDEQKLRFKFQLTPKLKATADQLKKDALLADKQRSKRVIKQSLTPTSGSKSGTTKSLYKFYKYLRRPGTYSYKHAMRCVNDTLHTWSRSLRDSDINRPRSLAYYMRMHYAAERYLFKINKAKEIRQMRKTVKLYSASRSLKTYILGTRVDKESRLVRANHLEWVTKQLLYLKAKSEWPKTEKKWELFAPFRSFK